LGARRRERTRRSTELGREALLKRSGLSEKELNELIDVGLIRALRDSDVYPAESGVIGLEAKRLLDLGLEPRHLRSIRLSADREVDLLSSMVAPLLKAKNSEAKTRAKDLLETCSDSIHAMHRALLAADLRQELTR
jgi:hypothetical protein